MGIGQIMDIIEKVTDYPYLKARAKAHVPVKNQGDHYIGQKRLFSERGTLTDCAQVASERQNVRK